MACCACCWEVQEHGTNICSAPGEVSLLHHSASEAITRRGGASATAWIPHRDSSSISVKARDQGPQKVSRDQVTGQPGVRTNEEEGKRQRNRPKQGKTKESRQVESRYKEKQKQRQAETSQTDKTERQRQRGGALCPVSSCDSLSYTPAGDKQKPAVSLPGSPCLSSSLPPSDTAVTIVCI